MAKGIVLGRFQPFHNGHEHLVLGALERFQEVIIAVGSSQEEWTTDNPFSFQERKSMIESWGDEKGLNQRITVVGIEDINDPPNWVKHATESHGTGTLVTTDEQTYQLYAESNYDVKMLEMNERERFEGWRIRQTAKMLSTVYDDEAVREVLKESIPHAIIEWLIENDVLFRLSTFETGVYAG
jgi:nicotinamide-nucleotide adenylyltransferase